jgi:hypothetical protein
MIVARQPDVVIPPRAIFLGGRPINVSNLRYFSAPIIRKFAKILAFV